MTLQLHDLRRVAHKLGLVVLERQGGVLRVGTAGTVKNERHWDVADAQQGLAILMEVRKGERR